MKAKLIYREGSSYFGGKNPYREDWKSVIEVDGKYYEIHNWGNYTSSGKTISAIAFNPENMPEEYERTEESTVLKGAGTKYTLTHGNGQETEINLTGFDTEYEGEKIPEELKEVYREEIRNLARKRIEETIKSHPNLDYHAIVEEVELTEEQKQIVQSIIDKIEQEISEDKYLELTDYTPIIENLVSIAKGGSVIVTHKNASYSRPEDDLINLADINEGYVRFATSGLHWDHAWGERDTKSDVFSLQGRRESFKDGTSYLGSYWKQGYSIDMMIDKDGKPYISRNVYENWANSQHYEGVLDVNLPVDRFDISTGEEGSFKEYNDEVHEKKSAKRDFYRGVMEQAKEQFGLSEKQAKILLDFAGTVSALSLTTDFEKNGLSTDQALAMLRKASHGGMEKVLTEIGMEYPSYKFDVIQRAAETLAYIHTLQENSKKYTPSEIVAGLDVREGEINETIGETAKIARRGIDKDAKTQAD